MKKTIPLIPPLRKILKTGQHVRYQSHVERRQHGEYVWTEETYRLGDIRSLLMNHDETPVRVAGSCGYGTWRGEKGAAS